MHASIMIVDDMEVPRHLLARLLRREGYLVTEAALAVEALAWLAGAESLPDVIILDVTMPEMDGIEMLRRVRRTPHTARVPVIMFSALGDARRVAAALADGAFRYWVKGATDVEQIYADVARAIEAGPGAVPPTLGHHPAPSPGPRRDRDLDRDRTRFDS